MKLALVFPGQGSQSVGMMNAYGDVPIVRQTFDEASDSLGRDLWRLVSDGPPDALAQTVNTQPIMLAAGVAAYGAWRAAGGSEPDVVAGHSLGEYTALVVAGVIAFRDAIALVQLRAQAMQEAVPQGEGAMAALVGLEDDAVRAACAEAAQGEVVAAANFNAPAQVVIAGSTKAVDRAIEAAKARGAKRTVLLPVSAPFHCELMKPAADRLKHALAEVAIRPPRFPVLHNYDVQTRDEPDAIRQALVSQAYSPVRWAETIRAMAAIGVTHVFECGPGKVLAGLTKRIESGLQGAALADAAGIEQALASLR